MQTAISAIRPPPRPQRGPAVASTLTPPQGPLRRFSVDEYHRLIEGGILSDEDQVELLDGYVVLKMPGNRPHDSCLAVMLETVRALASAGWSVRCQSAVTMPTSEPEPDLAVVRGTVRDYVLHHPGPSDCGLLIEIAGSSLSRDRDEKGPIYAAAGIDEYWIVNLLDRQIEVYSNPTTGRPNVICAVQRLFRYGDTVPLILDGTIVGQVAVRDVLP
jgi:Uma2 family endonuclease